MQTIDNALYDAFGQRFVSTTYTELNQYHIVMTVPLKFWEDPGALDYIYVHGNNNVRVPLGTFAKIVNTARVRWRSTTPDSFPLSPSHSIFLPAGRWAMPSRKSTTPCTNWALLGRCTASFRGRPRLFRSRSPTNRC